MAHLWTNLDRGNNLTQEVCLLRVAEHVEYVVEVQNS
jgi:hypothetical protein